MNINKVIISGNLTRNPELRTTTGGTQMLRLGVAINNRHKNQQTGEWENHPNFVDCVMFGTRAEMVFRFLTKGMKVAIEGKLWYNTWEKDGKNKNKIEIIIDRLELMSRSKDSFNDAAEEAEIAVSDC